MPGEVFRECWNLLPGGQTENGNQAKNPNGSPHVAQPNAMHTENE